MDLAKRKLSIALLLASSVHAGGFWRTAYHVSVGAVVAGNVADIGTSYGHLEMNPMLQGAGQRFGTRQLIVKYSIPAAVIGLQALMLHRHPQPTVYKAYTITNAVVASTYAAMAIRNARVK